MKTQIDPDKTRFPSLARAVLTQLGFDPYALTDEDRDTLREIAEHSAEAGWHGFTYYTDTLAFFSDNRREIRKLLTETADDLGEDMMTIVAGFGCLKSSDFSADEIAEAIYTDEETENGTTIRNALSWFALEEIAREMSPDA